MCAAWESADLLRLEGCYAQARHNKLRCTLYLLAIILFIIVDPGVAGLRGYIDGGLAVGEVSQEVC